jgi:hypothetical protein
MTRKIRFVCALALCVGTVAATGAQLQRGNAAPGALAAPAGTATAPADRTIPETQRAAMRNEGSALHHGTIEIVDVARGLLRVNGQQLGFDPSHLQVFGAHGGLPVTALRAGESIGFLLDSKDIDGRKIAVVYVP